MRSLAVLSHGVVMKIQSKYTKITLALASVLTLSACFEVEDDSNDELTAALQQQNQILLDQLAQSRQTNTVTISGFIVSAFDDLPLSDASITVKTATGTIIENQAAVEGIFVLAGLPANSALEIVVSSADTDFMPRVFYRNTGDSTSGVAEKDFGIFEISRSQEIEITVADSETNAPVADLQFSANSNSGVGASENTFKHISTFDAVNGVYKITLPTDFDIAAFASIDANRDGVPDFTVEDFNFISGTNLIVRTSRGDTSPLILLSDNADTQLNDVQLRLSIVDASASALEDAMVSLNDTNNNITVTFDADSGQYLIDAKIANNVRLEIPAFSVGDLNYQSANINIAETGDMQYRVSISNGQGNSSYSVEKSDSIELVLQPRLIDQQNTSLEILVANDPALNENNSFSVFYSQAVTVLESSISLFNLDAITVVKGNDNDADIVLPGTTSIVGGEQVAITSATTLNDTKLTLTPSAALQADTQYEYNISNVRITSSQFDVDLFSDNNIRFTTSNPVSDEPFDINDLRLDNNNYTTAGQSIVLQNTAGVDSTNFNNRNTSILFLPKEINQLKTLTLNQTSYTSNGANIARFQPFQIISNGQLNLLSKAVAVSAASNENIQDSNVNKIIYLGTTITDGVHYTYSRFEFLSDNIVDEANSISFDYAYETKAGEITTGSIVLPVL